jgi:hypothetical protein
VSDITKGRTMTHIGVEEHNVPKRFDARAMNIFYIADMDKTCIGRKPQKRHRNIIDLRAREKAENSL